MSTLRRVLIVVSFVLLAFSAQALAQDFDSGSRSLQGVSVTTSQTAVFAAFLSDSAIPNTLEIQTAISVSNVLATPPGFQSDFLNPTGGDTRGTLEFYLWNDDGQLYFYETDMSTTIGRGLNEDGTLGPGQTFTVFFRDILREAGFPVGETEFLGYGWVVANFDGVAGTYNVAVFDIGFTQSFELLPGVGQGTSDRCGLPVVVQ